MFYIVDKLKEQAIRRELKAGQNAKDMFYILRGRLVVDKLKKTGNKSKFIGGCL